MLLLTHTIAQSNCPEHNIYGTWKSCGSATSDYAHPPKTVNTDSLKNALNQYDDHLNETWHFAADGTYEIQNAFFGRRKGHFRVIEEKCDIELPSRKKHPIHIAYLDDSCMILWHNNPKTAYLTVYRR
ncbi:hypothetical protein ACTHGU_13925 [Chitinophagaceae bacterium MMS25-I14]